jgi:Gpi18-like mannosyltransferase
MEEEHSNSVKSELSILLFRKRTYLVLFLGMFLVEAVLALWTGQPYDMNIWFQTGKWMNQGINIYQPDNHLGYPPLWGFWCFISYRAYLFFANTEIWRLIVKLPIIFAHLACAYIIGAFAANRFGKKVGVKILLITLTLVFFIYTGAIWGQIDTISALLTFLAFYFAVKKRPIPSVILLGIAITLKIYPIVTLPAFFIYFYKNWDAKKAIKYAVYACAVPVLFTLVVFAAFRWDLLYFFRTIFYSTPVFQSNPIQIDYGCMNIFSFIALQKVNLVPLWALRLVWIPALAACFFVWLRKAKMNEADFTLAIISFYVVFLVSYSWIAEQTFLDVLPFMFLFILGYNQKRIYLYLLGLIQFFVFIFTFANQSLFTFTPMLERFWPAGLTALQNFHSDPQIGPLIWQIRGTMGLIVSLSLIGFLILLLKPQIATHFGRKPNR